MVIKGYSELIDKVRDGKRKTVVLIEADDEHALEAVIQARDIVNAVLIGNVQKIEAVLRTIGQNPLDFNIVQVSPGSDPVEAASRLIHSGRADFIMKGKITTEALLKGVVSGKSGLRKHSLMSHLAIQQIRGYHKLIFMTDSGMCLYPDLEQKKQILINTLDFMHRLGYEKPNVAVLCAVEKVNPKMPETMDAAKLKQMSRSGELQGCYVEGPISYDLVMEPEIAKVKGFDCSCSGDFDVLLVPNIVVGNVLGKCMVYTAGGKMAGLVLGAEVPIVLTSRGATAEEKFNSIAIAAGV